jgi:1-acyl-sn-glycerol-3-phosphate acyltransferase
VTGLRRAVTIPVFAIAEVLFLVAGPVSLLVAAVVAVCVRSTRPVRSVLLVLAYAVIELRTLARVCSGPIDWEQLLRDVLGTAYAVLRRLLDVPLELAPGSVTPAELAATGRPVVVLARHCGPGDSLFVAWLLAVHYGLRPHIVLRSLLRVEPLVDLAGDHLPLYFTGRHRARDGIKGLAAGMTAGDALLLFPEGRNFSWARWQRAITALQASGARHAAREALRRTHTLPPHHGGTFAALAAAPTADALLVAHAGFTVDGRNRPWWRLPMHRPFVVRTALIPAADVPRTEDALSAWLDTVWSDVDAWVAAAVTARPPSPG